MIERKVFKEEEYLQEYEYYSKQQKISLAIDLVIFTIKDKMLKVLVNKRLIQPYKNLFSIPGGFARAEVGLEQNAKNILFRDTNIDKVYLEQLYTFGELTRDKRGRTISIAYYALIDYNKVKLIPSEKYQFADWYSLSSIKKMEFAFDHKEIINMAIERIKNKIQYTNIAFQLLPEKFTLAELQDVYEIIIEEKLDKRNFRKKIFELDMIEELEEFKKDGRMRPAKYYRFKERTKETILKPKKWI